LRQRPQGQFRRLLGGFGFMNDRQHICSLAVSAWKLLLPVNFQLLSGIK
jgi:hypothetical protein